MSSQLMDACKSFLTCHVMHSEEKTGKVSPPAAKPFVTLSRQSGAGGVSVCRFLTEYLRERDKSATCPWTVFDKNMVEYVLEEHHLPKEFSKYMSEEKTSEVKDIMETLFELHPPAFALVKDTSETILHLAQLGYAVIVGRAGNVVTRKLPGGIRVRLTASLERRIERAMEHYDLTESEARDKIKKEDKGRRDYLKQNFGKDIDDPSLYDLVIQTDRIAYEDAAVLIGEAVLRQQAKIK